MGRFPLNGRVSAVIPAAGRGSRLGGTAAKVFTPLSERETIWSLLYEKLAPLVDALALVLSPAGAAELSNAQRDCNVRTFVQRNATGMGDAVMCARELWECYDVVLIVWGDQVFVSQDTMGRALALHGGRPRTVVVPLVASRHPYVDYVFEGNHLREVLQTREGDTTRAGGLADVGTFVLSTETLFDEWQRFESAGAVGSATHERNFLPFFVHLAQRGWLVERLKVTDEREARGINSPEDLRFARELLRARG